MKFTRTLAFLLALVLVAAFSTGCVTKKKGAKLPSDPNAPQFDEFGNPILYDEFGNPILSGDALGDRPDGAEFAAGQFEAVYFAYDNSSIDPAEMSKIQAVASYLQQNASVGVIVEGHCDERGSNEYNLALGERRALAVRAAIANAGVDSNRIQTRSYGEENPIAFGHDDASWRQNRRAEFILTQM